CSHATVSQDGCSCSIHLFDFSVDSPGGQVEVNPVSEGAGWVVPKTHQEKVGPNGFKTDPIGAGPCRVVKQSAGTEIEFEAFTDYWRKPPNTKTILMPGDAAGRIRENALCKGAFSSICVPEIDDMMAKYDSSTDVNERKKLLDQVQTTLLDNYYIIPILRQAFINLLGPRIANKPEEVEGAIPQYVYLGPYEDIQLTG